MTYLTEAFRTFTKHSKPWYDKWNDEVGNIWSSVQLPRVIVSDLKRTIAREGPSSCLPNGWSFQIDPSSGQPFFVLCSPGNSTYVVLQQWHHPSSEGFAVGFHSRNLKSAKSNAAHAACDMLASIGRLGGGGGGPKGGRRSERHPASPPELRRLASEDGEWYICGKVSGKRGAAAASQASLKGLRSTLSTCFTSYRWGKLSACVSFERQRGGGSSNQECRVRLPDEVLDELPELAETARDQRWVRRKCFIFFLVFFISFLFQFFSFFSVVCVVRIMIKNVG
jgi:hypothetical protein